MMLKKHLKPIYLLFLLLPLMYLWLGKAGVPKAGPGHELPSYFNCSALSKQPLTLSFYNGRDSLCSWALPAKIFRNLEYAGGLRDDQGYSLRIQGLAAGDTLCISNFNISGNWGVRTAAKELAGHCSMQNGNLFWYKGFLRVQAVNAAMPVILGLPSSGEWKSQGKPNAGKWITGLFILCLLILIVMAPPRKVFIVILLIAAGFMLAYHYAGHSRHGQVSVETLEAQQDAEVFYNSGPVFDPTQHLLIPEAQRKYSFPLNFSEDDFMRFDVAPATTSLSEMKVMCRLGCFSKSFSIRPDDGAFATFNDIRPEGKTFRICGPDPYVSLNTADTVREIAVLNMLSDHEFVLGGILIFIVLLLVSPLLRFLERMRFKPAYLSLLLLPLSYWICNDYWRAPKPGMPYDFVHISAKASRPAALYLINGKDSLAGWMLDTAGFKVLQYGGKIDTTLPLRYVVAGLQKGDTLSILSVNMYHKDQDWALLQPDGMQSGISNVRKSAGGSSDFVVQRNGEYNNIILRPFNQLVKNKDPHWMNMIIGTFFILCLVIVILLRPSGKYVIITTVMTSAFMMMYFWLSADFRDELKCSTDKGIREMEVFYNINPEFLNARMKTIRSAEADFCTPVDLVVFNYLRCDLPDSVAKIGKTDVKIHTGLLSVSWNYNQLPTRDMVLNDLVVKNGELKVTGKDPYFALTSASLLDDIKRLVLLRSHVYVFLSLIFFMLLLAFHKRLGKLSAGRSLLMFAFLMIISTALLLRLFNSERLVLTSENRVANRLPAFRLDSPAVYVKKMDNYLTDQLSGRAHMIVLNNLYEYSVYRELVNNDVVIFGKDGWMFYRPMMALENYENKTPLTNAELERMRRELERRRDYCKARGIRYYVACPPMSYNIYEEKVGVHMQRYYPKTKFEQFWDYMRQHSDLEIIDLRTPLMKAKAEAGFDIYYKDDTHWNCYGAWIGYSTVINRIRKDVPGTGEPLPASRIKWNEEYKLDADLMKNIALEKFYKRHDYLPDIQRRGMMVDTVRVAYPGCELIAPSFRFVVNDTKKPKVLLFHDSFGAYWQFFVPFNFSTIGFFWTHRFYPDIIEGEKPDIIIQEMAEYTVLDLLKPQVPLDTCGKKAGTLHKNP
jgi:hypothetical protein